MKVTRAGRQPCDHKYSRLAERIEALQAELTALASELSVVSGNAGQAVVTAEGGQASAEASAAEAGTARTAAEAAAATAQGVSDRVTAAEAAIDDVQAYAEVIRESVTALDTEIHTTRPYMTTNTEQVVSAKKHIPTATANDSSDVWVNKAFVQANGANKPNNLVHDIGDEVIYGVKTFDSNVRAYIGCLHTPSITVENEYTAVLEIPVSHRSIDIELFTSGARGGRALLHIDTQDANDNNAYYLYRKGQNSLSTLNYNDAVVITVEADKITVWLKYRSYSIVQFWVSMYIQYEIIKYDAQLNYLTDQVHMSLESLHDNYNRILYPE